MTSDDQDSAKEASDQGNIDYIHTWQEIGKIYSQALILRWWPFYSLSKDEAEKCFWKLLRVAFALVETSIFGPLAPGAGTAAPGTNRPRLPPYCSRRQFSATQ